MKSKTFLATGLTAMTLLSAFPTMTVFAESPSDSAFIPSVNMENVSPRYRYIQSATISVHPNKSETIYILDIRRDIRSQFHIRHSNLVQRRRLRKLCKD